jgi:hypothetical protein
MARRKFVSVTGTCVLGDEARPKKGGQYDNPLFSKRWRPVKGKVWKDGKPIPCNPDWEYRRVAK